jgi:hypothetical protein
MLRVRIRYYRFDTPPPKLKADIYINFLIKRGI